MENIIKYSRPKNYQGRYNIQATTVSVSSDGGGGDGGGYNINWDEIENYINNNQLWKNSHAATSLVPRNSQNDARGDYSVAIGDNTLTYHRGELSIGHFNKSTSGTTTYFTIGNGTSNANRSNLFEVNATKTTCYNPFSANTISAQTGNFTNLKSPNLSANTITAEDASITNLSAITSNLSAATIGELEAEEATIDSLSATSFSADTGQINTLEVSGLTASGITTQYLTVTKSAHFFELIIDKIKAAGGSILLTPADGFRVDRVGNNSDGSRTLYFRSNNGERAIKNMWQVNDQAICQSFNQARVGQTQNVRNKYYWALVTATGTTTIENEEYHYITISGTIKEGTLQCEIGDEIAMLGHRGTDKTRQSAIFISAYSSYIDTGVTAPCIVQYENVNSFNLTAANRKNVISHNLVSFTGDFTTTAGDNVANYLSQLNVTVDGINTRVGTLEQKIDFETQATVDATSLDPTKCYPVTISFGNSNDPKQIRCAVSRTLIDTYGVPNYSTHQRGFVLDLDWTTRASGWGTNWVERRWYEGDRTRFIQEFEVHYTDNTDKVVGSIGQVTEASIEVVYVRGGSKYDILTSFKDATITLHPTGYIWENQEYSVRDERPVINYTDLVVPVKDRMGRSEIKQTADNIQLNVYNELNNKTGIDVSNGTITLDADNTTIVGNLNITDTDNGITVFDPDGVGRVYLQPDSINDRQDNVFGGKFNYFTTSKSSTGNTTYYTELNTITITTLQADNCLEIGESTITIYSVDSSNRIYYPSNNILGDEDPIELKIQIYKDSTLLKTYDNLKVKYLSDGFYRFENRIKYTTTESGTYGVKFYILSNHDSIPTNRTVHANVNTKAQWSLKTETYLGQNGLYAHSAPNKYFWVNEESLELRNEGSGIRFGVNNRGKGFDTIVGFGGTLPNAKPLWLPFHNYTPVFSPSDSARPYKYGNITNINATKYYYQIDPVNDYGMCLVEQPALDSNSNKQDTWILLPPENWKDEEDNTYNLPIGYTVTIINNTLDTNKVNCGVAPSTDYHRGVIIKEDRGIKYSIPLDETTSEPWQQVSLYTFIYVGTYGNVMYWRIK